MKKIVKALSFALVCLFILQVSDALAEVNIFISNKPFKEKIVKKDKNFYVSRQKHLDFQKIEYEVKDNVYYITRAKKTDKKEEKKGKDKICSCQIHTPIFSKE